MTTREDQLISRILKNGDEEASHELLDEINSGYPVTCLLLLLESRNPSAVQAGVWIASELGDLIAPLIPELSNLLSHPSRQVRFFVLDSLLNAGTPEHGEALGAAVERIQDADEVVRWKAMNFLARASEEQLTASLPFVGHQNLANLVRWLIDTGRRLDTVAVVHHLEKADRLARLVAAAAAVRLASRNEVAIERAVLSLDREISSFAREQVRLRWWRSRPPATY